MELELDVIRSERRRNSSHLYNLKQYHAIYHQSKDGFGNFGLSGRKPEKCECQNQKSASKRKILTQILPSRLIIEKRDEEIRVDNISTTLANQRRASDTYSPYGTRTFPSLRQRPPSTDSNLSLSTNSLAFSVDKSDYKMANGNVERNSLSTNPTASRKISSNSIKQLPLSHHRISLTAPRQPPYLYQSQSKARFL